MAEPKGQLALTPPNSAAQLGVDSMAWYSKSLSHRMGRVGRDIRDGRTMESQHG